MRALCLSLSIVGLLGLSLASAPEAEAAKPFKNLKVIKDTGKTVKKGMKDFTKGLGVKCSACHVKGKFDSDDVAAKVASRKFLEQVVGNKDAKARDKALAALLKELKLSEPKNAERLWRGIDKFEKK